MMIKDSGKRREFDSGAVRDIDEGKGRCDLLPLDIVAQYLKDDILKDINNFVRTGDANSIYNAVTRFITANFNGKEDAILEVAKHYADGCSKYGERNWEKGIPVHCYIDSGVRHYLKCLRGDNDERHDRAFLWNMFGCLWTVNNKPDLNDLPYKDLKEITNIK